MESRIKDESLYPSGDLKIDWVRKNCPLLRSLEEDFSKERPFEGKTIALSIHLEAKTAYLCKVLAAGGAEMYITGSNPLSTQDDVAASLVHSGLSVFAHHGCSEEDYFSDIKAVLSHHCNIIIDDGGDLVHMLHTELTDELQYVIGGCEETTTGIMRLHAMDRSTSLTTATAQASPSGTASTGPPTSSWQERMWSWQAMAGAARASLCARRVLEQK